MAKQAADTSGVVEIGGGWKALDVPGLGVIVQAEMGLIFVDGAMVNEAGRLEAMPIEDAPAAAPRGPVIAAESSIKAFLEEVGRKNLGVSGEYGPMGPTLAKLKEVLSAVEPDSPLGVAFGDFLALGNHDRFRQAAAVLSLNAKQIEMLNGVLNSPELDIVQSFVARAVSGNWEQAA
jgi:hypothetical protein